MISFFKGGVFFYLTNPLMGDPISLTSVPKCGRCLPVVSYLKNLDAEIIESFMQSSVLLSVHKLNMT